jgi:hypothetical protein
VNAPGFARLAEDFLKRDFEQLEPKTPPTAVHSPGLFELAGQFESSSYSLTK